MVSNCCADKLPPFFVHLDIFGRWDISRYLKWHIPPKGEPRLQLMLVFVVIFANDANFVAVHAMSRPAIAVLREWVDGYKHESRE